VGEGQTTVWCLLGKKAGDNTQVLALSEESGFGYQEKQIVARPWELLTHLTLGVTLAGIDRSQSSPLEAPWPDVVISAGRRNEPVARWIQRQSGGRTHLVHIGRPWSPLSVWSLVVTTPQYFLPRDANIVHNSLPLHRISETDSNSARERWQPRIADLPRPWIAVLVGGDSGRFVMTAKKGETLGSLCTDLASAAGGSLLVTDSARTPPAAGDALIAQFGVPHVQYRWGDGGDNPYHGLLALADAFVVTGESMSMLGEAVNTGRPLFIFDVGDGVQSWWKLPHNYRYKPLSHRLAMRFGPQRMRRDIGKIQEALVNSGAAQWLAANTIPAAARDLKAQVAAASCAAAGRGDVAKKELERAAEALRLLVA
jgi:mitochondrial fission protein ELM1